MSSECYFYHLTHNIKFNMKTIIFNHITNSYKMYKREALQQLCFESLGGFEIGMEITAKIFVAGGKIVELPSRWWDRTEGKSNFKLFTWLPKYLKWYFYVLRKSRKVKG